MVAPEEHVGEEARGENEMLQNGDHGQVSESETFDNEFLLVD